MGSPYLSPMSVRAKKHLGQHFLTDESVARDIADTLTHTRYSHVLEIGPGMGVLTKYILEKDSTLHVAELDGESVEYLNAHYLHLRDNIHHADFLKMNLAEFFGGEQWAVTGNYPYNISSQIMFRCVEYRDSVQEITGMFQKEVAQRIAAPPGSRTYGVLSVLVQAYYDCKYCFTVPPTVFDPPPKVDSGVIQCRRLPQEQWPVDYKRFRSVVKVAFNQRRKTLRNSLRSLQPTEAFLTSDYAAMRPEQLSVTQFKELVALMED